jgi:hypothetical protein
MLFDHTLQLFSLAALQTSTHQRVAFLRNCKMASFWDNISSTFGRSVDSEHGKLPLTPNGKRKAREPGRSSHSAKVRRRSTSRSFPSNTPERHGEMTRTEYLAHEYGWLPEGDTSPYVTGFTGHRNSLDRPPSTRKGSGSQRRHSGPQDSVVGFPPGKRRRPSTSAGRIPVKSVQQNVGYLDGLTSVVKTAVSKVTGGGPVKSLMPETEADLQAQLLDEHSNLEDSDIQNLFLAEFAEESESEQLSEGEWGRKHFAQPPWSKHQVEWEDPIERDPPVTSR